MPEELREFAHPIRVLIVDDSEEFLEQSKLLVESTPGLRLEGWATSGAEALAIVDLLPVDLVLLDLRMPGLGGLETTSRLRWRTPAPRVVIVSLHDEPEYRRAAERAGADGFLPKTELADGLGPLARRLFGRVRSGE